ncbi:MAG: C4-type zinc ribbon domain-containing protein [Desulfotomaculaceae bacterium]|nr:C4-type zinc ribbon domain-containing protein [Desulfotomaculaceae bacterium]
MPDLKSLLEIQILDGRIKALETELRKERQSVELKKLRGEIKQGRAAFEKLKETYNVLKNNLNLKEISVAKAREQADSLGQKLYSGVITNVKEMDINSKKLESLTKTVSLAEDEILRLMERKDDIKAQLSEIVAVSTKKIEEYRKIKELLLAKQQQAKGELDKYQDIIQKMIEQLDPGLWNMYRDMKNSLHEPLARVERGTCMGCRMGISYREMRLLKQGEGLVYCGNCGRILYWEK